MTMQGKTAIVTGGGRDIGRACVMELAAQGANVVINYHSSSAGADSAVEEIKAAGGSAIALQGDMTSETDVKALVAATVEAFGKVDSLIHVTGGLVARVPMSEMTLEHWHTVMNLNTTSLMLAVRECLPHMGEGSSIVTLASQAGRDGGGPGASAYGASKGAVMTLTRGLAKELGPKIRVNGICPGMINTDFHNTFTKPEVRSHVANITPLKREGNSDEVAKLAVYLASDGASFITGTNVDINGGMLFS
ncbi:SDR family NAD(P)-dependent oxidoreductase [uncultured Pelagimonas sp.]|uniref:SDR family NAD(P)-dependent oxidoreductase n=1 Tax=uncultured Pelagimonas sp. TaxID=1618102 RepID=UPI00261A07D6|nr:SDR family NAD(P)-dependent oxidoreductase [uncultured Pelagimonas sp.]